MADEADNHGNGDSNANLSQVSRKKNREKHINAIYSCQKWNFIFVQVVININERLFSIVDKGFSVNNVTLFSGELTPQPHV